MFEVESARDDGIDFVVIATPNHLHFSVARSLAGRGNPGDERQARHCDL